MSSSELVRATTELLKFFHDDRSKNLLKSFSVLSQSYVDMRAAALHGVEGGTKDVSSSSSSDDDDDDNEGHVFSIFAAAGTRHATSADKFAAAKNRAENVWAVCSQLLSEMLQLLVKVKEHGFVLIKQQQPQQGNHSGLKDAVDVLITKLQGKAVAIHVIFNEVNQAIKDATSRSSNTAWRLTVEQLRVYQMALVAEMSIGTEAPGSAISAGQHPLESTPVMLDRISALCSKRGVAQ